MRKHFCECDIQRKHSWLINWLMILSSKVQVQPTMAPERKKVLFLYPPSPVPILILTSHFPWNVEVVFKAKASNEGSCSFGQLVIWSTCHYTDSPFFNLRLCHCVILSTWLFAIVPFFQFDFLSTCHFANLPLYKLAIISTLNFVNCANTLFY